ncbi:MAG: PSD1 and planctomycete cytochrome C domain-containing protein [Verrucomicrobiota bacterium]
MRALTTSICLLVIASIASATEPTVGEKLYALRIAPMFAEKCNACHGDDPGKIKGGFDMRTRDDLLWGGDEYEEEVVVLGKGEESFLYKVSTREIEGWEMPPKEADKLTEEETWWIRDWINEGAPWPDDERVAAIQDEYAEGEQVATSLALSEDWQNRRYETEKLWSYRPLAVPEIPADNHPIDYLISRKLDELDLPAAPAADATTLARRLNYTYTGLPPTPVQVDNFREAFKADPDAAVREYGKALMDSVHYGERFGSHWLDVTRYADTAGFANDYHRPHAWRYRDYVIRSFNRDRPYDEFVREQLAGDLIDAKDPENLVATGFLRMGPWEHTGMSVFREMRQQWLDDVTDSVGQTFLAHAMQCAKCHDHKFDPVPTRDYYQMMAAFSTTQFAERPAPLLAVENRSGIGEAREWADAKIAAYEGELKEIQETIAANRRQETGEAKVGDNGLTPDIEASQGRVRKNITRHKLEQERGKPFAFAVFDGGTKAVRSAPPLPKMPPQPWAQGEIEPDHILTGGDAYSLGDPVTPGVLSAAVSLGEMEQPELPQGKGPRRLGLADWIVDPQNPLTARVMVNRLWTWHFGRGIANNPNNFGGTGELPTHPELLDFLAHYFIESGWSVRAVNQLILSSETFRRSTEHPDREAVALKDPRGEFYAVLAPRRLTAEELRDSFLAVSGELNRTVGGIPVRPDINPEVAIQPRQIMGGTASVYEPDPLPQQRNRRTVYAERIRGLRDPFLETFNQPGFDASCEVRETSTIAPQALTLFNSAEVQDRSLAFADRLLREMTAAAGVERSGKLDQRAVIRRAFRLSLGRHPSEQELIACVDEWNLATKEEQQIRPMPGVFPTTVDRTVMAEKTGEPYTFTEVMPAYRDYVPDLQRSDVDARTRGLAHICLVLFNLNEFVYIN